MKLHLAIYLFCLFLVACSPVTPSEQLFQLQDSTSTGISFVNTVENSPDFNIFSYRNFYNGGGVALGDINEDGLTDIYFTNNMGSNALYLNKGNFKFEDITQSAGVAGTKGWSTGVVMVDLNADGLLDIYVCNAGYVKGDDQENELFINNGDGTFTESAAAFQLNENGYTTHAAFFDYDQDGDLDVYMLNNSFIPVNTLNYSNRRELRAKDWAVRDFLKGGGDKLLRNDEGKFVDVSEEAGIYGSLVGFGLGVTVGDINDDLLPDIYVSNDFYERDYLYINQGDGTFSEEIKDWMQHISLSSMGADMADINNDGYPEIFVTEMLPATDYRRKTTSLFENYSIYQQKLKRDFYHQYMQNTLQLNNQNQSFSEIAHFSGVAASDWSWGALMFDADNDGFRDLYVCNGIYQDVTDQDFMDFFANDVVQKMALTGKKEEMENVIAKMPSNPQPNKAFRNGGDLKFEDIGESWGLDQPSFSNGAAYADLDNDGDLDLVVNNLNQEAFVYRNQSESLSEHHYLQLKLKGKAPNTRAIGSKVSAYAGGMVHSFQMIPSRGFQSSIDYKITLGLGQNKQVDSLVIYWPDQSKSSVLNPPIDSLLALDYESVNRVNDVNQLQIDKGSNLVDTLTSPFAAHQEDAFVDFFQEGLTMRMLSREGPKAAVGDVNGDGTDDVFIGASTGKIAKLYLQKNGTFIEQKPSSFERENYFEDTATRFFDADGDGDLDLFVGSGGNSRPEKDRYMQDRVYLNDGLGNFQLNTSALPNNGYNTAFALAHDYDEDGDQDLIVGSRSVPNSYGMTPPSYLYENDGQGKFTEVSVEKAPAFARAGMLTDATLVNLDTDPSLELLVTGEWMEPKAFKVGPAGLQPMDIGLQQASGWWYTVESLDVDQDGDQDLVLGNRGENFYFTGTPEAPAKLWVYDFDGNRTIEKIITQVIDGKDMPVPLKKELTDQIVSLKKQNLKHTDYATKSIQDLFSPEVLDKAGLKLGNYFQSAIAINDGTGKFTLQALPKEVQLSCVCDIYCGDLNGDELPDLILGGNDSGFTPQFSKLDASYGHVLINNGAGALEWMPNSQSGLFLPGDLKQLVPLNIDGASFVLANMNNSSSKLLKLKTAPVQ